ncbi:MAG: hypothetical protein C5B50_04745 [Verrucomicrobia bacterium]|nr:MAG: hypothetical protein C5B50_04745 [Verrucomicrobiota bacterium]
MERFYNNLIIALMKPISSFGPACLALFVSVSLGAAPIPNDQALWRPRFATPTIVALDTPANRQFTAEIRAAASASSWGVIVSNDLRAWTCSVVSVTQSKINRGTEPGWEIRASVPADIPPELFTLVVSSSETVSAQRQALSIITSFTNDFYLLHITDEQIVNQYHTAPSGMWYNSVGTWEEMKWMQEPVNLINPRFVVITGDQIDYNGALDGWNNWANWGYKPNGKRHFTRQETLDLERRLTSMYKDCHAGYRVPFVSAPGNHDVPPANKTLVGSDPPLRWHPIAVPIYESEFGQRSWSLRMGDFYVLMHDWSERSLRNWAEADFKQALNDPTITYRLIGQHYTNDQAIYPSSCDLMLVGHGHGTATLQSASYYIYMDGPSFRYGMTGFFNFRRMPNGWACDQTVKARDTAKDVWPLFTANGAVRKVRSDQADAMNITADSITITNDLPDNFYDGRVRFIQPQGRYSVSNGTILAHYDYESRTRTAVLVRVNIPPNGSVTVGLVRNQ